MYGQPCGRVEGNWNVGWCEGSCFDNHLSNGYNRTRRQAAPLSRAFPSEGDTVTMQLEVMNPRGEIPPPQTIGISARVSNLDGKKIVLIDNGKFGANNFLDALADMLKDKYPKATIVMYPKPAAQTITDLPKWYPTVKQQGDLFVFGVGD